MSAAGVLEAAVDGSPVGAVTGDVPWHGLTGVGAAIAELTAAVEAPAKKQSVAVSGTGVRRTGADRGPVGAVAGDLHRNALVAERLAVAELTVAVGAPAEQASGATPGASATLADAHPGPVGAVASDLHRSALVTEGLAVAELPQLS